jgi:hypothetical protein
MRDGASLFAFRRLWPGTTHRERWAKTSCHDAMHIKNHIPVTALVLALCACSCSPPAGSFDVVVASFTNRPSPVHVGSKVVFNYTLKNLGTNVAPAGSYYYDLYVDGHVTSFDHATSAIKPGLQSYHTMARGYFHWQPTNAGQHRYELVIVEPGKTNRTSGEINVLP